MLRRPNFTHLSPLVIQTRLAKKNYYFQVFVADMGQKITSFKTVSHIHLLTINGNKSIFFGSKMGQTKHKP